MNRQKYGVIGLAIIWAAVIFASSLLLGDTVFWGQMLPILGGGAASSILIVGGSMRRKYS